VHHIIAAVLNVMPTGLSIGIKIPTRLVATSGSRQYPSTDAERANVRPLGMVDAVPPPDMLVASAG
jgi:hypothetical protein